MSDQLKISTIPLDSCCGCHMALVNLGTELLDILAANVLVFSPVLMDKKSIQPCTVALVEGGVRNHENAENLKELREKADILIALGTCASFGGISGMGSAFTTLELLSNAYGADFSPEDLPVLAAGTAELPRVKLRGLMCVPPPQPDVAAERAVFSQLRKLLERLNADGYGLDTLSMGMSGDFESAIAEGATHVRIGTALFGSR